MNSFNIHLGLLEKNIIVRAPHILRLLKDGEQTEESFFHMLCDDLMTGRELGDWVASLLYEGDIELALHMAEVAQVDSANSLYAQIQESAEDWAKQISDKESSFLKETQVNVDVLSIETKLEIANLKEIWHASLAHHRYGEALATLLEAKNVFEQAMRTWKRRQREEQESAELRLAEVRLLYRSIPVLPGGEENKRQIHALLNQANNVDSSPSTVLTICDIVQKLCEDQPVDEQLLASFIGDAPSDQQVVHLVPTPIKSIARSNRESTNNAQWDRAADEFLIENHDKLTPAELMERFTIGNELIEQRMEYLGLMWKTPKQERSRWKNPYVVGKPLRNIRTFYGRDEVFKFIENSLGNSGDDEDRNIIILEGHRRTGKTSILLQLCKNRRSILAPRIPIFITLESLLPFRGGTKTFFYKIACKIQEHLTEAENIILPQPEEDQFIDPAMQFQRFLRQAERAAGDVGFVLMLDEFQIIDPKRSLLDVDVYKILRSVMQHDPRLDFILSGTLEMEKLFRDYKAALFGSALRKRITFLDPTDAEALIIKPTEQHLIYDREAVKVILDITASHPYFVQLICWALADYLQEHGKKRVQVADIERIIPQALDKGVHFAEIWTSDADSEETASPEVSNLEQYITALMGEMIDKISGHCLVQSIVEALHRRKRYPQNSDFFDEAIDNLINRQIISSSSDGKQVSFQVDLFRLWVKAKKPFISVERDILAKAAKFRRQKEKEPLLPPSRS